MVAVYLKRISLAHTHTELYGFIPKEFYANNKCTCKNCRCTKLCGCTKSKRCHESCSCHELCMIGKLHQNVCRCKKGLCYSNRCGCKTPSYMYQFMFL